MSMDFNSKADYAIGEIIEFHLRALRVLRGAILPVDRPLKGA